MKKAPNTRGRTKGGSYSGSGDDSYNNSIYQIRTNHQKKSIPYKLSNDTHPSIVWVGNEEKLPDEENYRATTDFSKRRRISQPGAISSILREHEDNKSPSILPATGKNNSEEVRMVLQPKGSPPVEVAAKVLPRAGSHEKDRRRTISIENKIQTEPNEDSFQSKLKHLSLASKRSAKRSDRHSSRISQSTDKYSEDYRVHPKNEYFDEAGGNNALPAYEDSTYAESSVVNSRRPRSTLVCSDDISVPVTQMPVCVQVPSQHDFGSKCDLRVNKNCNDSKTCDCCDAPKKVSKIYLCEKHPLDSRTYCCREVLDRDLSAGSNVVYVSPSRISKKNNCECSHHETPHVKKRATSNVRVAQNSRSHIAAAKPGEDCKCVRKFARAPCSSKCTDEFKSFLSSILPKLLTLLCVLIKYLLVLVFYLFLLWMLRLYTSLNHYAHLTLLTTNLLMLFILLFKPECLLIYAISSA